MSGDNRPLRLGVFGGTFDPVHLGHLIAAQDASEALQLDRVLFMPAFRAPLKEREPGASDAVRVSLLRAAVDGEPLFEVSTLEIQRGGISYSVETARELRRLHPDARLFWILGADQAERLEAWHRIEELGGLLEFIVLARPGYDESRVPMLEFLRLHFVRAHVFDISSSEIRARLSEGRSARFFLPAPVADRIERESLYR